MGTEKPPHIVERRAAAFLQILHGSENFTDPAAAPCANTLIPKASLPGTSLADLMRGGLPHPSTNKNGRAG